MIFLLVTASGIAFLQDLQGAICLIVLLVLFLYPVKMGVERQALPLFMLCAIPISSTIGSMRRSELFVMVSMLIIALSSVLLIQ